MADDTFNKLEAGKVKSSIPKVTSTGVAEAGKIIKLDSAGKLDPSLLPTGVGPDVLVAVANEALVAGDYVNVYDLIGVTTVRKADNSNGRPAHGFVKAAVAAAANATVFFEGANDAISGKTRGARQYLGTGGASIETPLDPNTAIGDLHQFLGIALEPTQINTDIDDCIQL